MGDLPTDVAVIVLDYYGTEATVRCLNALRAEPVATVYLVDNSGDSEHALSLKLAVESLQKDGLDYYVDLLTTRSNLGFAAGVNHALRHDRGTGRSHGVYVLLNNDVVCEPGSIGELVGAVCRSREPMIAASALRDGNGTATSCERFYHRLTGLQTRARLPGSFRYLPAFCLAVPAELVSEAGLFDEDFFMYGEDVELAWKLHSRAVPMHCVQSAVVVHASQDRHRRYGLFYEFHMALGHLLLARKTASGPLSAVVLFSGKMVTLAIRAVVRALRYRSLAPFRALAFIAMSKEVPDPKPK